MRPDQWKESVIVQIHKKDDKTDCNNYLGISLLSTSYKIVFNIHLSRLGPYIKNSVARVHERSIQTERPRFVGEVNASFCGYSGQYNWSPRLYSRL
jgi:hypothetical protein